MIAPVSCQTRWYNCLCHPPTCLTNTALRSPGTIGYTKCQELPSVLRLLIVEARRHTCACTHDELGNKTVVCKDHGSDSSKQGIWRKKAHNPGEVQEWLSETIIWDTWNQGSSKQRNDSVQCTAESKGSWQYLGWNRGVTDKKQLRTIKTTSQQLSLPSPCLTNPELCSATSYLPETAWLTKFPSSEAIPSSEVIVGSPWPRKYNLQSFYC